MLSCWHKCSVACQLDFNHWTFLLLRHAEHSLATKQKALAVKTWKCASIVCQHFKFFFLFQLWMINILCVHVPTYYFPLHDYVCVLFNLAPCIQRFLKNFWHNFPNFTSDRLRWSFCEINGGEWWDGFLKAFIYDTCLLVTH